MIQKSTTRSKPEKVTASSPASSDKGKTQRRTDLFQYIPGNSGFENFCVNAPDVAKDFFEEIELQDILMFREVSKFFCNKVYLLKLLSMKSYIDFEFARNDESEQEKVVFAKDEEIEIHVTTPFLDNKNKAKYFDTLIVRTLKNSTGKILNLIDKPNYPLKTILEISNIQELKELHSLSPEEMTKWIQGLNFSMNCDQRNANEFEKLFNLSFTKQACFNTLISLRFGHITSHLTLPPNLIELRELSIAWLGQRSKIIFPKSIDNLLTLKIDRIDANVSLQFPTSMKRLKKCIIGNEINPEYPIKTSFNFADTFNGLKELCLGNVGQKVVLEFTSLKSLESLTIGSLEQQARIVYPKDRLFNLSCLALDELKDDILAKCPNLLKLKIETVNNNLDFNTLRSLATIYLGQIYKDSTIKAPKNLNSLTINIISPNVVVSLDEGNHLNDLTIGSFCKGAQIKYPTLLPKLIYFSINIEDEAICTLPESFKNLQTLEIDAMNGSIHFPSTLDRLTSLQLGRIKNIDNLFLPQCLPNLTELTIANHKAILCLSNETNQGKYFVIETDDVNIKQLLALINDRLLQKDN